MSKLKTDNSGKITQQLNELDRNVRNTLICRRGYRARSEQISPEARNARLSGTPTEKSLDLTTYKTASNYGKVYTEAEHQELAALHAEAQTLGHYGRIVEWAEDNGRNYMAALQRARLVATRRR